MRGFAIDLTDLVRRQAENVDATSKPPLPEAEAMTLQERFAELNDNPVPLTPGTLVTYKPGFEQRYVYRPDIAVLDLRPDGTAGIALLDRRWLKLWEPPPAIGPAPDPEAELNALKPEAIALFQTGHSARDVHRQLDVPLSLAARWVEEFRLAQTDEAARRLA
jgi:hypothetical protein